MLRYSRVLLLAVAVCAAHARSLISPDLTSPLAMGDGTAAEDMPEGNLDKSNGQQHTSSAVADWSLVCQQLCGAALGGVPCSAYCRNVPHLSLMLHIGNADITIARQTLAICASLCGLQQGDAACTCKDSLTGEQELPDGSKLKCTRPCEPSNVTLADDCGPCSNSASGEVSVFGIGEDSSDDSGETVAPKIALLSATVEPITITTATAKASDATEAYKAAAVQATTPNWQALCASLCKTGDGGSLCNCDISPFMV